MPLPRPPRFAIAGILVAIGLAGTVSARAETLVGAVDTGELFQSDDGGMTWTVLATLPVSDAVALAAGSTSSTLFLATRSGAIHRSSDSGGSWDAIGTVPESDVVDLAIFPDETLLVLTSLGSLHRSTDGGESFSLLATMAASDFAGLALSKQSLHLHAVTQRGDIFESIDQGLSWTLAHPISVSNAERILAVDETLYVLTDTGDVYRRTDEDSMFLPVGTLSQVGFRGLVRYEGGLAAATREGHLATSSDGSAWTWRGSIDQLSLTALGTDEPSTTGVPQEEPPLLEAFNAYPNPSTSGTVSIVLALAGEATLRMAFIDVRGRVVASRPPERLGGGTHAFDWSPPRLPNGVYLLRLEAQPVGLGDDSPRIVSSRRWTLLRRPPQ